MKPSFTVFHIDRERSRKVVKSVMFGHKNLALNWEFTSDRIDRNKERSAKNKIYFHWKTTFIQSQFHPFSLVIVLLCCSLLSYYHFSSVFLSFLYFPYTKNSQENDTKEILPIS